MSRNPHPRPRIPNPKTVEAMLAARRGEMVTVGSIEALLADLHAEDDEDLRSQTAHPKPLL